MSRDPMIHPRDLIVEMMKRIYDYGMTTVSGGNLSIMDDNGDMWISPSGVDKGTLRREDIVCVKADGSIEGIHKPSCEYPFHKAVFQMRPDVKAVMHAHPPAMVAFSIAGVLPQVNAMPEVARVCGKVGYAGYAVPGSEALGKLIAAEFAKGCDSVMMKNHGCVVIADSLNHCFERLETLDFAARTLADAARLGKVKTLDAAELAKAVAPTEGFVPVSVSAHSTAEKEARRQMCEFVRRSYRQKLFNSTCGTWAVRLDAESFLITPSGVDRAEIMPEDIVLVKGNTCESGKSLSRAAKLFKAVFDKQPAINTLVLAMPPSLMAYAVSGTTFEPKLIPESYIVLREVPEFPFGATRNDMENVAQKLSPRYPVILVENEFVLVSGASNVQAYDRLEVAEYSAIASITALNIGSIMPINDAEVAEIIHDFNLQP